MPKMKLPRVLLITGLLFCSACTTARYAPVVEKQEPEPAAEAAPGQAGDVTAEQVSAAADGGTWTELPPPATAPPVVTRQPGSISDNPAVVALLDDTDLRLTEGDAEGAASSVERALRLEPKNPGLWHRLAVLRFQQGQWRQAAALAEKSNSLSIRHPELRKANAELIKRARMQAE